jgi:hypothetical protein
LTSIPTNPLSLFNLRESPYFQDALQAAGRYPLSLFVGREDAAEILLRLIRFGYIRAHSEQLAGRGRPAAQYVITGAARLVAGIAYTWDSVV